MLENSGIANLALQGGSGEGYGSLPTDFEVVEGTKRRGKVYKVLAGKRCTVYSDVQCFKYGVTGQLGKLILALHQVLCLFGLQSQPLIMPKNGGIANLSNYGGSRDRHGSLPADLGLLKAQKGGERCLTLTLTFPGLTFVDLGL
nr:hypothetical protein [Tanacetum cinerariifolium]